jgi:hypothetical protein
MSASSGFYPLNLRLASKDLISNPQIVIKKADKGSAMVVMDTTGYMQEATRQLSDITTYQELYSDHFSP